MTNSSDSKQPGPGYLPGVSKNVLLFILLNVLPVLFLHAQDASGQASSSGSSSVLTALLILVVSLAVLVVLILTDQLAKKVSRLAPADKLAAASAGKQKPEKRVIRIKRGMNIHIKGKAIPKVDGPFRAETCALKPGDFVGMSPIPKVELSPGDEVKAGDILFYDKKRPEILYASPVSGEIAEIRRGEKRRINEIVILADKENRYREFEKADPASLSRGELVKRLVQAGAWPFLRQRPFDIVPDPNSEPDFIWVSTFDTSPLAPDYHFVLQGQEKDFRTGVEVLKKLADGNVHFGVNDAEKPLDFLTNIEGIKYHWFKGPHPAGNVGIQVHHVRPLNKNTTMWYIQPQDILVLGRLFNEGRFDTTRLVAVAGSEIKDPHYVRTFQGANIEKMVRGNLLNDHVRYISGNVLTGTKIASNGFLGFYDNLVTVIEEGDTYEMFGWLFPSYPKPTASPTFFSYLHQGEELPVNTNMHGGERAFVVTGLYERVLPMDVYPMQLLKAILTQDFEKMEGLGIYEISKEDFALCEFVCPSKTPIQDIVNQGLELIRLQG